MKPLPIKILFRRQATLGKGKFNVMTLTTKNATEFFFHVFPDQHIEGEGVIMKEEKSFLIWSPFLEGADGDGIIREFAGGAVTMAESDFSGKHRNGVKVWKEYTFTWTARKAESN